MAACAFLFDDEFGADAYHILIYGGYRYQPIIQYFRIAVALQQQERTLNC